MKETIQNIFENKFDKSNFKLLITNIFSDFSFNEYSLNPQLNETELERISNFTYLGTYQDSENKTLDLLIVELKSKSVEKSRGFQRNLIGKYLKSNLKDSALVAFHSKDNNNWRLSFIKIEYQITDKGIKVVETPAKRYSFLIGETEPSHTAQKQLLPVLEDKRKLPTVKEIEKCFSVEKVTKEFYEKIAFMFTKLTGRERFVGKKKVVEKSLMTLPSTDDTVRKEFAVRLIGRLLFCWFLKKKKSPDGIPLIPEEILSYKAIENNYYHNILEPLFFETLNTPIDKRMKKYKTGLWELIPFLNGGLFEPQSTDYYEIDKTLEISKNINTVVIPDEWFKELFEIFEIYNFTIDENTSIDIDLSIEPEMLGRIFENLLAEINPETGESARKSTGSYYTPREIVEYMVNESIKQYLINETGLTEDVLSSLLSYGEEGTTLTESQKDLIIEALDKIKIIDPACGSGAFPMGILQKILLILQKIDPFSEKWFKKKISGIKDTFYKSEFERKHREENWSYIHKLGIIQNSIYGIDIQPIAVEISRLRFFLSLILDQTTDTEKENRGIMSLPNLEFKFVCANSLIGLPKQNGVWERIEDIQIPTKPSSWFDPKWMFGVNDGFDIVIANPPYVGEKGHKEIFREIKKSSMKQFYQGKMNLFYFFFHLSLNLGKKDAIITFITTNYYLTANGAKKLRQDFKERAIIKNLINFNELRIFESALGQHNMITILKKSYNENEKAKVCITKRTGTATCEILRKILNWNDKETNYYNIPQKDLYDGEECYIRLTNEQSKSSIQKILEKIRSLGENNYLGNICNINQGIVTGADKVTRNHLEKYKINSNIGNGIFILNKEEIKSLNLSDKEQEILKPWFKNSDIHKWFTLNQSNEKIIYLDRTKKDVPIKIKEHLQTFKPVLENRREVIINVIEWWYLHWSRVQGIFESPKIVVPQRNKNNIFAYNETSWYASADVYFITENDKNYNLKYILALLNSRLYYLWLYHKGKRKGKTLELYQTPLSEIPIKKISFEEQKPFIEIVDRILSITKENDYLKSSKKQEEVKKLELKIDQMVYKLYGLTDEEIAIVERGEPIFYK